MSLFRIIFLSASFIYWAGAEDVVCSKKTTKIITIEEGELFSFKTRKNAAKIRCKVTYKTGASCPSIQFSCSKFKANCKGGDKMKTVVDGKTEKYCKKRGPNVTASKILKVWFISNKKTVCTAQCASTPATTSAPSPTGTTVSLEKFGVSGDVKKFNKTHTLPSSLAITWIDIIEGASAWDGTEWTWTGGFSRLNAPNFSLDMELDEDTFAKNIRTSDRWSELAKNDTQILMQLKSFKFAMGYIFGVYNNDQPSSSSPIVNDGFVSKGPNNETALADRYAVFYKQGTLDALDALDPRTWLSKVPQGFSCGVGAPADESSGIFERYIPVNCSTIEIRVASRFCSRDEKDLEEPRPDCYTTVNWT